MLTDRNFFDSLHLKGFEKKKASTETTEEKCTKMYYYSSIL